MHPPCKAEIVNDGSYCAWIGNGPPSGLRLEVDYDRPRAQPGGIMVKMGAPRMHHAGINVVDSWCSEGEIRQAYIVGMECIAVVVDDPRT